MKENENVESVPKMEMKKTVNVKEEKVKESETKIYIGPSLKGIVSGTVLKNGITPVLEAAIQSRPVIGELVIPIKNIVQANKELKKPDSALQRFYRQAEKYKKGGTAE